jgi:hypothetical protein
MAIIVCIRQLIQLGLEILAQALIDLVKSYRDIDEVINRLISSEKENAERLKKKILNLNEITKNFDW